MKVAGIQTVAGGFGLSFGVVDSTTAISADGARLATEDVPKYSYSMNLPRATTTGGNGGIVSEGGGIQQLYGTSSGPVAQSQKLAVNQVGPNAAVDASNPMLGVVPTARTFFIDGATYSQDAVIVWDITNTGGQISFGGSFTAPNGGATTTFLTSQAGLFDQTTFNKMYIGSRYWGGNPGDLDNIKINSVVMEVIPEPATFALLLGASASLLLFRRKRKA